MIQTLYNRLLKAGLTLALAFVVAFGATPPRAAKADPGEAIAAGIIGLAIYCGATGKCDSSQRARAGGGGGLADAKALDRTEAMWVQGGLQATGFYTGPIDGAIGAGTRASIRAYQAAIGAPQTGGLTGAQINDLVALSPEFSRYGSNSPKMFRSVRAHDLDRDGVRQLQAALNAEGYGAGSVDGSFGPGTQNAVARYMAARDLPGQPYASRRLLAKLLGQAAPEPAGAYLLPASARSEAGTDPAAAGEPAAIPATMPAPAATQGFDILGVALGMTEAQAKDTLMTALGGSLLVDTADAATLGAEGAGLRGFLTVQPGWPQAPSEQVMVLFDDARPDLGAVGVFRMIRMPDAVDQAAFETQVLPDVIANYGGETMVEAANRWVANPAARTMSPDGAACGDMTLALDPGPANALDALWRSGGGPRFAGGGPATVAADCGEVLDAALVDHVMQIGLWNATALSGASAPAAAPKLKF